MAKIEDEPAFPSDGINNLRHFDAEGNSTGTSEGWMGEDEYSPIYGMTLRDYFAAKAMQAYMRIYGKEHEISEVASFAYQQADAMLAERAKD